MYPVSAEYISAMNSAIQKQRVRGSIGSYSFTSYDIAKDSMTYTNQCSDTSDLTLGGVYIGTLKMRLLNDLGISRGSWRGKKINLTYEQCVDEINDRWEAVPVGVFTISEANHSEKGIELVAYDNVSLLDKPYPETMTQGTVYDIMRLICSECGLTYGLSKEESEALPNGKMILACYPENGCETWRDVAHFVAQVVGGFLTVDRRGNIILKNFGSETHFTVDTTKRLTGSKFSDFETLYTGLSVVDMAEKTTRYVSEMLDNGLTVNLGSNPFLQYGIPEVLTEHLRVILREANKIQYTPFTSSMVGNPAFDLGDLISYVGGTAGTESTCCLMSIEWKFGKSYSVKGFGKNPSLANAKSKAEKDISGLSGTTKGDVLRFITFENAQDFTVGNVETLVAELRVTNTKETFVDFWIEFKLDATVSADQAIVKVRYALDDLTEPYEPVQTYNHDGTYILGLHYFWKLEEILRHSIKVYLTVDGGQVKINASDIHARVHGQGLTDGKAWDGKLVFKETYHQSTYGRVGIDFNDNTPTFVKHIPKKATITDTFLVEIDSGVDIGFVEVLDLVRTVGEYQLITEDGKVLTTENDIPIKTEGAD